MPTPGLQDSAGIPIDRRAKGQLIMAEGGRTASPSTVGGLVDPVYSRGLVSSHYVYELYYN